MHVGQTDVQGQSGRHECENDLNVDEKMIYQERKRERERERNNHCIVLFLKSKRSSLPTSFDFNPSFLIPYYEQINTPTLASAMLWHAMLYYISPRMTQILSIFSLSLQQVFLLLFLLLFSLSQLVWLKL
jgi:hypothetical protein